MALESFSPSPDFSQQETLTKAQEAIVNRVLKTLEDTEKNEKVSNLFSKMFDQVAKNDEQFNALMKSAGIHEANELKNTEIAFKEGKIQGNEAQEFEKKIITRYTRLELRALKQHVISHAA